MAVSAAVAVKAAVSVLADEKKRRKAGRIIAAILSPLILALAAICCMAVANCATSSRWRIP